jgi:hypothetical protein
MAEDRNGLGALDVLGESDTTSGPARFVAGLMALVTTGAAIGTELLQPLRQISYPRWLRVCWRNP